MHVPKRLGWPPPPEASDLSCSIASSQIFNGGPGKDGIPALTNPEFVQTNQSGLSYLRDDDRVVGFLVEDQAYAVPLNIFWWHEIVNLDVGDTHLAITHCPLTGSSKDGTIFDDQTRTVWRVDGLALQGPLSGSRLETGSPSWPSRSSGQGRSS